VGFALGTTRVFKVLVVWGMNAGSGSPGTSSEYRIRIEFRAKAWWTVDKQTLAGHDSTGNRYDVAQFCFSDTTSQEWLNGAVLSWLQKSD
jgi:hypothetical protein